MCVNQKWGPWLRKPDGTNQSPSLKQFTSLDAQNGTELRAGHTLELLLHTEPECRQPRISGKQSNLHENTNTWQGWPYCHTWRCHGTEMQHKNTNQVSFYSDFSYIFVVCIKESQGMCWSTCPLPETRNCSWGNIWPKTECCFILSWNHDDLGWKAP